MNRILEREASSALKSRFFSSPAITCEPCIKSKPNTTRTRESAKRERSCRIVDIFLGELTSKKSFIWLPNEVGNTLACVRKVIRTGVVEIAQRNRGIRREFKAKATTVALEIINIGILG